MSSVPAASTLLLMIAATKELPKTNKNLSMILETLQSSVRIWHSSWVTGTVNQTPEQFNSLIYDHLLDCLQTDLEGALHKLPS